MKTDPIISAPNIREVAPCSNGLLVWLQWKRILESVPGFFEDGRALLLAAIGICWLFFFSELRGEWGVNPQYNYGYVVPLLCAALFWRRWPDRPKPSAPLSVRGLGVTTAVLLFLFFPLRLFLQANPEWRLLYWINAIQMLSLSSCLLGGIGGWPWVRHFAPPILFSLIAVPWPMQLEAGVIQGLMRVVAALTVEIAGLLGIPALQLGNLIEVSQGVVGIDEACSGVRSLQSGLMLSLFLGEMYRFPVLSRLWLLISSLFLVLIANLTRTSFLVWAAAHRGMAQMEAWHNLAGVIVMLIVLPGLLALAHFMRPKSTKPSETVRAAPAIPIVPRWIGIFALVWIGAAALAVEAWYQLHEKDLLPTTHWGVSWPMQSQRFKKTALPERALAILRCSTSDAASWEDRAGNEWSGFFLRWAPGRNSAQLAKGHRPDTCFISAGAKLVGDYGQEAFSVGNLNLLLRHQTFDTGIRTIHAFYCLWPDKRSPREPTLVEDWSRASRLQAVFAGKRHLGQQALEIVVAGPTSRQMATALVKAELPELIQVENRK